MTPQGAMSAQRTATHRTMDANDEVVPSAHAASADDASDLLLARFPTAVWFARILLASGASAWVQTSASIRSPYDMFRAGIAACAPAGAAVRCAVAGR